MHFPASGTRLQDTHLPSHALSQHTPSTQKPEAQTLALPQARPFLVLQLPLPSHACPSAQLPGTSVPAAACMQVPSWPLTRHDLHGPEQDVDSQHTPSTQLPDAQAEAVLVVQLSPLPRLDTPASATVLASGIAGAAFCGSWPFTSSSLFSAQTCWMQTCPAMQSPGVLQPLRQRRSAAQMSGGPQGTLAVLQSSGGPQGRLAVHLASAGNWHTPLFSTLVHICPAGQSTVAWHPAWHLPMAHTKGCLQSLLSAHAPPISIFPPPASPIPKLTQRLEAQVRPVLQVLFAKHEQVSAPVGQPPVAPAAPPEPLTPPSGNKRLLFESTWLSSAQAFAVVQVWP